MNKYPRLATRLYNVPLLISPAKGEVIEAVFRAYCEGNAETLPPMDKVVTGAQRLLAGPVSMSPTDGGFMVTNTGVAVIPVHGTMVQRADALDSLSGMTGYGEIGQQLEAALSDRSVTSILLDIDSPGGEVGGVADLAAQIRQANTIKPVRAFANEMALSAAYWMGAAAGDFQMAATGTVGSIGVIAYHLDASQAEAKRGLSFTPIYAGDRKADLSRHAPLSSSAKAAAQDLVDHTYAAFAGAVAKYRNMPEHRVRNTEAGIMHSTAAVHEGFVDGVSTFADAISTLAEVARPKTHFFGTRAESAISLGATDMNPKDQEVAAARAEGMDAGKAEGMAAGKAQGIEEGKKAGFDEGKVAGAAEATKTGADAERLRVSGILTHAEAAGRRGMAEHLAFKTNTSVDDAVALLAAAPKDAAKPTDRLAAAMADVPNPKVGADANLADGEETAQSVAARILAAGKSTKLKAVK